MDRVFLRYIIRGFAKDDEKQRWLNDATCNGLIIGTLGVNKFHAMSCNRALMTGPLNTVSCIVLYTNIYYR